MSKKLTTNEFIYKSALIHDNKYDYSNVRYEGNKIKVNIKCPIHGLFLQTPNDHMMGRGCAKCKGVSRLSTEEFILKSQKIHKGLYEYSETKYKNTKTPVVIVCKIHGKFLQKPNYHLCGNGCKKCAYEKNLSKNSFQSKSEIDFLTQQHISIRAQFICGYYVDGFDPNTNTIYEFLGDYWHGNPAIFNPNELNKSLNQPFDKLYNKTFERFHNLKSFGYNIKYIWESDWKIFKKGISKFPKIIEYI